MRSFSVAGRRVVRAIDLSENEAGGIITLLDDVEPRNTGFTDAIRSILDGCLNEMSHAVRFHMNVHVNDMHELYDPSHSCARIELNGCNHGRGASGNTEGESARRP